ncbi:Aste57867_9841 [Aphanomyces stellatus]|uniref:Aste57867_9841 protein n=1 Tax=Aphanomyces stellatus TaxID=120398 RepID=A0A485KPH0_9STRA|nr:hypothetical protein As57867_009802 [Aphanomyces stellatus]VFT86720.1 Aste57867_9841 [Aphanomyces stellatus]
MEAAARQLNETTSDPTTWADQWTAVSTTGLVVLPILSLAAIVILLRVVYKPASELKDAANRKGAGYGAIHYADDEDSDIIYAGYVAGNYSAPWTSTFDVFFLGGMFVFAIALVVCTSALQPVLWSNHKFWSAQAFKVFGMLVVSTLAGFVCRRFSIVDDKGYIITSINSAFKVNYTRKCQHFAAYLIPLLNPWEVETDDTPLELAWAYFLTLVCFLVLIQPVRERFVWCMLQFNGLDRPEDRPHTLQWLVAGDLLPGFLFLVGFKMLMFDVDNANSLLLLLVLVTTIGDGLAEPVGIAWGRHKYSTPSCVSTRRYSRTLEGSACVFMSAMVLPALLHAYFANVAQVFVTMVVLPPLVTYAEATAPHTMDTPILIVVAGAVLYGAVHYVV